MAAMRGPQCSPTRFTTLRPEPSGKGMVEQASCVFVWIRSLFKLRQGRVQPHAVHYAVAGPVGQQDGPAGLLRARGGREEPGEKRLNGPKLLSRELASNFPTHFQMFPPPPTKPFSKNSKKPESRLRRPLAQAHSPAACGPRPSPPPWWRYRHPQPILWVIYFIRGFGGMRAHCRIHVRFARRLTSCAAIINRIGLAQITPPRTVSILVTPWRAARRSAREKRWWRSVQICRASHRALKSVNPTFSAHREGERGGGGRVLFESLDKHR